MNAPTAAPSAAPSADQIRRELARRARVFRRQLGHLEVLADDLRRAQPPPTLEDETEPATDEQTLLSLIDCVTKDHLIPALEDLERAARKGKPRRKASPR